MSATTDTHAAPAAHVHEHPSDQYYFKIFALLFGLTGIEVLTYFVDMGPLTFPVLMILMVVKFFMVLLFFMHLKFDAAMGAKIFGRLFYTGLVLALAVYIAALACFHFFV